MIESFEQYVGKLTYIDNHYKNKTYWTIILGVEDSGEGPEWVNIVALAFHGNVIKILKSRNWFNRREFF